MISVIDVINDEVMNIIYVYLVNDPLVDVLWNFGSEETEGYDEVVVSLMGLVSYTKKPAILDLYLKNRKSLTTKPSII